jgi:hypothetical protein
VIWPDFDQGLGVEQADTPFRITGYAGNSSTVRVIAGLDDQKSITYSSPELYSSNWVKKHVRNHTCRAGRTPAARLSFREFLRRLTGLSQPVGIGLDSRQIDG